MKDYIKNKIKKAYHLTLQGANRVSDEDAEALSANINNIQKEFRVTTPTLASKLFLSTARLETLDLISEGPIEGFFNNNGEACNILEATFIDETPIVESTKSRKAVSKFKVNDLRGCFVDYSTGAMDILNDYQGFLDNKFPMKQRVRDPHSLQTVRAPDGLLTGDHLASDGHLAIRNRKVIAKYGKDWLFGGARTEDRKVAVYFIDNNLARTYEINGQTRSSTEKIHKDSVTHLGKGLANGRNRESGAGYTLTPYVNVRYYGQDEIAPLKEGDDNQKGSGNFLIPNINVVDLSRPKRYQGSVKHGAGLTTGGSIDSAFVSRSFIYQLTNFYDYSGKDKSLNGKNYSSAVSAFISAYAAPVMFSGQHWGNNTLAVGSSTAVPRRHDGTAISGHRPVDVFYDFEDSALYPRGLKEPIIQAVQNKIKDMPYKGHMILDKYGVFSSPMGSNTHKYERQNQSSSRTIFHNEVYDSEGTASRKNVIEIKALKTSSSSFRVEQLMNGAFSNLETSNHLSGFFRDSYDLRHFDTTDRDATYTISYDYYIPSDNQACRGFEAIFHSKDYNHNWALTHNFYKWVPSTFQTGVWTHYEENAANLGSSTIRATGKACRTGKYTISHRGPAESGRRDDRAFGFAFTDAGGAQNGDYADSSLDGDSLFITNLRIKKNDQENTSVGSKTGYFIFDSNGNEFHDDHIAPDYELNFGLQPRGLVRNKYPDGFRYWRIQVVSPDATQLSAEETSISQLRFHDSAGNTYPSSFFSESSFTRSSAYPDSGNRKGPFTHNGITVSGGYDHAGGPSWHVFDGISGDDASDPFANTWFPAGISVQGGGAPDQNYIDIDFGEPKDMTSIDMFVNGQLYVSGGNNAPANLSTHFVISGSNIAKFKGNSTNHVKWGDLNYLNTGNVASEHTNNPRKIHAGQFVLIVNDGGIGVLDQSFLDYTSETEAFNFNTQSSESLNYVFPEITGFSGRVQNIVEPLTRELDFNVRDTGQMNNMPLTISGSSQGFDHNIEITEQPHKKFRGPALWPVFLGETMSGMKGVSDGSFEKVLITSSDSKTVANNKLNSGIEHKYDVFSGDFNGEIVYVNLANPAIEIPASDVTGKTLSLILQEREPSTFNYANVSVYNNLGDEIQEPLTSGSLAEHTHTKQLKGPFVLTDDDAKIINTGTPFEGFENDQDTFNTYFRKSI